MTKGSVRTWSIRGRLKRGRSGGVARVVEGRARPKSNTVGRSRLMSFRFMNGKSAGSLERAGECQRVNLDPATRTRIQVAT